MNKLFFILAVVLVLPLTTALSCSDLDGESYNLCKEIQDNDLSSKEKDLLILNIINPPTTTPDFDFVYDWNKNLDIKENYQGRKLSSGVVRDVWVKIVAPMPSVVEDGDFYVAKNGKILSEYDYSIQFPTGKSGDDCKTKYSVRDKVEELNIYADDKLIGHEKEQDYSISQDTEFKAELIVTLRYWIKHYRKNDWGFCRYKYKSSMTSGVYVSNDLDVRLHKIDTQFSFDVVDKYNGVIRGILEVHDVAALELSFTDSYYKKTNYIYSLGYTLPYYVLTLYAEKYGSRKQKNIYVDDSEPNKYDFIVKNSQDCRVKLFSHFEYFLKPCDLTYNDIEFDIKTDKTTYDEGDEVLVEIFPKGLVLNLAYADENVFVKDFVEFEAIMGQNKIIAQLNQKEVKKIINIVDPSNKAFFIEICLIFLVLYLIFKIMERIYLDKKA